MERIKVTLFFIIGVLCTLPVGVHAAYLQIQKEVSGVYSVSVYLDNGETVNGVEGKLHILDSKIVSLDETDSVMGFWAEKPKISNNIITFAGIIPGGFSGMYDQFSGQKSANGKLFSIALEEDVSIDSFSFIDGYIYKNDGIGTKLPLYLDQETRLEGNINDTDSKNNSNTIHSNYILYTILVLLVCLLFIYSWQKNKARKLF